MKLAGAAKFFQRVERKKEVVTDDEVLHPINIAHLPTLRKCPRRGDRHRPSRDLWDEMVFRSGTFDCHEDSIDEAA